MFNPDTATGAPLWLRELDVASSYGIVATPAPVHDTAAIEAAITKLAREPGGGLIILPEPFTVTHSDVIIAAAARRRLPLIGVSVFAEGGGLMSYWINVADVFERSASYVDRILRGAKPAELPVEQWEKFSLTINLKTAKALGLTVPSSILAIADKVIE